MKRSRLVFALVGVFLTVLLAGCANIPESSEPQAVVAADQDERSAEVAQPAKDADPLSLVRAFVEASADPGGDHASARAYLAGGATDKWNASQSVTVIADPFDTVPAADPAENTSQRTVILRGKGVGKLSTDGGFLPDAGDFEQPVHVGRQADGQWRIVDPSPGVVITLPEFLRYYRQVRVYFLDPALGIPVPDLRYVPTGATDRVTTEVVDLLLSGPSDAITGAVRSAIPPNAVNKGSGAAASDGAISVNLAQLGERNAEVKKQIAAQVVLSLQGVTNSPIRLQADGEPLFPDHPDWRPNDVPSFDSAINPSSDQAGLVVANGRLVSLRDGSPAPGSYGGDGLVTAAQSIDGTQLAVVDRTATGVELRLGRFGQLARPVGLSAGTLSRPSWRPGNAVSGYEVWTVADGQRVFRLSSEGGWTSQPVDATALTAIGPITNLRLSRDGVRAAAVVGGRLVVAAVLRHGGTVSVAAPQVLQGGLLTSVTDVDWQDQDSIVAVTASSSLPVVKVPVDGLQADRYDTANLTLPLSAVTAAPGRPVVVVDADGLWSSPDVSEVWRPGGFNSGAGVIPFYPG